MEKSVQENTVKLLVNSGAVSDVTVVAVSKSNRKRFSVKFKIGIDELAVASKREPIRLWSSLDTVAEWLREMGITDVSLKIV